MVLKYPRSKFYLIECPECGTKRIVFSHSTRKILCSKCGKELVLPSGGKAIIKAKIIKTHGAFQ